MERTTVFKKGMIPWNKGKKGLQNNPLKGKKMSEEWKSKLRTPKKTKRIWTDEQRKKLSQSKTGKYTGSESSRWKGGVGAEKSRIRRNRILQNGGSHTNGEWETLKAQYNWTCPSCIKQEPSVKLTKDHIISIRNGGSDNISNIQPLCPKCNVHKHTKNIKY